MIFGAGEFAEVAKFYFDHDSDYTPVAFTVDRSFMREGNFSHLPVIPFEDLAGTYPPGSVDLFVAIGYSGLNRNRAEKVAAAKALGYTLGSFLSSRAWAWPGFELGENSFIFENKYKRFNRSRRSERTRSCGAATISGITRGSAPIALLQGTLSSAVAWTVGDFCFFIGVNATIREHITVGERCIIGMHAVVSTDAAPGGVYAAEETTRRAVPSDRVKL